MLFDDEKKKRKKRKKKKGPVDEGVWGKKNGRLQERWKAKQTKNRKTNRKEDIKLGRGREKKKKKSFIMFLLVYIYTRST
jgi:hypothetical protein